MTPEQFFAAFEVAANTGQWEAVAPFIADDAIYWFTDGTFEGLAAIRAAFEHTWATIKDEVYSIHNLRWIVRSDDTAVCLYDFRSQGSVDGSPIDATGHGTNVLAKRNGSWKIIHEHLSRASVMSARWTSHRIPAARRESARRDACHATIPGRMRRN